jgi:hypothetical protein
MIALIVNGENIKKNITVRETEELLGGKYNQRVVTTKAGQRICIWYSDKGKGRCQKVRVQGGDIITVRGTIIFVHEEYGAYEDITDEDIGVIMLVMEE